MKKQRQCEPVQLPIRSRRARRVGLRAGRTGATGHAVPVIRNRGRNEGSIPKGKGLTSLSEGVPIGTSASIRNPFREDHFWALKPKERLGPGRRRCVAMIKRIETHGRLQPQESCEAARANDPNRRSDDTPRHNSGLDRQLPLRHLRKADRTGSAGSLVHCRRLRARWIHPRPALRCWSARRQEPHPTP